jgi:hypothetical protein
MNQEEKFLNTSMNGFEGEERRLLEDGWKEKRYSRHVSAEIENAFRRFLLKKIILERTAELRRQLTPEEINALFPVVEAQLPTLYTVGANGGRYLKFKMYTRPITNTMMNEMAPEEFINENKVERNRGIERNISKLETAITKARKNIQNIENQASAPILKNRHNMLPVYQSAVSNARGLMSYAQSALKTAHQLVLEGRFDRAQYYIDVGLESVKQIAPIKTRPANILANMMGRTSFGLEEKGISPELREYYNKTFGPGKGSKKGGRTHKRKYSKRRQTKRR